MSKPTQRVIVLPPGGAQKPLPGDPNQDPVHLRTRNGHFACLVPGCGLFESAVQGERRHHFRHASAPRGGAGHEPESVDHLNAKHELANWLEGRLGSHLVRMFRDEHQVRTPEGVFEPDVYAELDNGVKIALEYQHSPGDPGTVLRKQHGYAQAGISCWWLFSPYATTCRRSGDAASGAPRFLPIGTQRDLVREKVSFHWFHAELRQVGTPLNRGRLRLFPRSGELWTDSNPLTARSYCQPPWKPDIPVLMGRDALDRCHVDMTTGELVTPTDRRIREDRCSWQREEEQLREDARRRYRTEQEAADVAIVEGQVGAVPALTVSNEVIMTGADVGTPAQEDAVPAPPVVHRKPWWKRWLGL